MRGRKTGVPGEKPSRYGSDQLRQLNSHETQVHAPTGLTIFSVMRGNALTACATCASRCVLLVSQTANRVYAYKLSIYLHRPRKHLKSVCVCVGRGEGAPPKRALAMTGCIYVPSPQCRCFCGTGIPVTTSPGTLLVFRRMYSSLEKGMSVHRLPLYMSESFAYRLWEQSV